MVFPRQVLNSIKWRDDRDVSRCKVAYLHRGAKDDMIEVSGDEISELGRSFFRVRGSMIPYHRILRISYDGDIVYRARR